MPDDHHQTERPDLWLTETSTPGLLVQTDINSGESEPVFAGVTAPQPLTGKDAATGESAAVVQRRSEIRALSSAQEVYDSIFNDEASEAERNRRLNHVLKKAEQTFDHIRSLLS